MAAKEQNVTISIKVKLYPDQKTIEEFKKLTTAYSEAATWLSDLMFNDFSSPGSRDDIWSECGRTTMPAVNPALRAVLV